MDDRPPDVSSADAADLNELLPLAYEDLRELARHLVRRQAVRAPRATSLVHDVYVRLAAAGPLAFESEQHFLRTAARAMRCVLVDDLRRRTAAKRGGRRVDRPLDDETIIVAAAADDVDVLAVDEALATLARIDPARAMLVELRFFGGLTIEETARTMDVSPATVKRDWALARAWLYRALHDDD